MSCTLFSIRRKPQRVYVVKLCLVKGEVNMKLHAVRFVSFIARSAGCFRNVGPSIPTVLANRAASFLCRTGKEHALLSGLAGNSEGCVYDYFFETRRTASTQKRRRLGC
jgi:hypothetical protein